MWANVVYDKGVRCQCTFRVLQHIVICLTHFPALVDQQRNIWLPLLWADCNPSFSFPLHCLGKGEKTKELGMKKCSWDWDKRWGKGIGVFAFVCHHSSLILIGNKVNVFSTSWVCFACGGNRQVISLSLPICFSILFSSLCCWGGGVRDQTGGCLEARKIQSTTSTFIYCRAGTICNAYTVTIS